MNQRTRILNVIRKYNGVTCDEVEDYTGIIHQSASAHITDLSKHQLVRRTGKRRNTKHGKPAHIWVAA